jgi:hypothetical protein
LAAALLHPLDAVDQPECANVCRYEALEAKKVWPDAHSHSVYCRVYALCSVHGQVHSFSVAARTMSPRLSTGDCAAARVLVRGVAQAAKQEAFDEVQASHFAPRKARSASASTL